MGVADTETHNTAGAFYRALNYVNEFRRRHPDVPIIRPSEGRSGMWEVDFSRADRALFSSVERMAEELRTWERGHA